MKKYIVTEEFLSLYKQIVDEFTEHSRNCERKYTECCTCGLTSKIRYMRKICEDSVKPYNEIKL